MATYRTVKVCMWSDPWFEDLDATEKLFYLYLFTNEHINNAGIMSVSKKKMAFESGVEISTIDGILKSFNDAGKIVVSGDNVWVVNFIRHQTSTSPKMLSSIAKALEEIEDRSLIDTVLERYNTLSIPYQYPINTVPVPPPYPTGNRNIEGNNKKLSCGTSADDSTSEGKKPLGKTTQQAMDTYGDFARKFQEHVSAEMGNLAPKLTDALILKGAVAVDQCVRIDGFSFEDIRGALNWAVRDDFWRNQVLSLGCLRSKKNGAGDQTKFQKLFTRYAESGKRPSGIVIYRQEDKPPGIMPDDAPPMMYDLQQVKDHLDAQGLGRVNNG